MKKVSTFSLIEVCIAILIAGFVLGGFVKVVVSGFSHNSRIEMHTKANQLIEDALEEFSRLPLPPNGTTTQAYGSIPEFPEFRRSIVVSDYLVPGALKQIRVSVWWDNDTQVKTINTLKASF